MKMVVAIIRHERLQEVQDVLDECGVSGVTVTEVKGCGAQRGYTEKYRGASVHISLRPRLKVEAVMQSEVVKTGGDKLAGGARAGGHGGGGGGEEFRIRGRDTGRVRPGGTGPAPGGLLVDVHVQLADHHLADELVCKLLHRRRHHPTGAAPIGVEVHHDGFACLEHIGLESRAVKVLHVFHASYKPWAAVHIPTQ